MIPIRLKIKGLYSYRELVVIDFEKLASEHLFGIFGAVGSGKSAILEAITYALYGHTERLNASGDNRNYNMMNLQSQEMLIEFEFKTMVAGVEEEYLFRVKQSRNSKTFSDVRSAQRGAYIKKDGEWQPLPSTDATGILTLSYENFIKTIIIPQGKFQDFLQMGSTQRTRMLREIFSLDRFELDRGTKTLLAETREQLVRTEEQLMPLAGADEAEIAVQEAAALQLEGDLAQAMAQEQQLQVAAHQFRQLKEISEKIESARLQLAQLTDQQAEFALRETKLLAYQRARLEFSELLNQVQRLEQEWQQAEKVYAYVSGLVASLEPQLAAAQAALIAAKKDWEGKGKIEAEIQDCGHWTKMRAADGRLGEIETRLGKGDLALQTVKAAIAASTIESEQVDRRIVEKRANLPDLGLIGEVKLWFQQKDQFSQQGIAIKQQISQLDDALAVIVAAERELAASVQLEESAAIGMLAALQTALAATKSQLSEARSQRERIVHQSGLAAFALDLQDGQPCPLCGGIHHPLPYNSGQSQAEIDAANQQIGGLEQRVALQEKAIVLAQGYEIRQQEMRVQRDALQEKEGSLRAELTNHIQQFRWPQYQPTNPERLESDRKIAAELQQEIAQQEQIRLALQQKAKVEAETLQKYEVVLSGLREEKSHLLGQRETHRQQLTVLTTAEYEAMDEPALGTLSRTLQSRLAALQSAYESTQKAAHDLEIQVAEARQQLSSGDADRSRLAVASQAATAELAAKMATAGFADVASLQAVLAARLDVERERAAIDQHKNALLMVTTTLQTLEGQANAASYDAAAHASAEAALEAARALIGQQQQALSLLRAAIAKLQDDLARRKVLEAKQRASQKRLENLRLLENLFKASGFVKYVSTIYLEELVRRADVRFRKLTRNALSLELGDESDFLVRDMLNGGQTRSVKTLSGGQTFQASLCLALALADNVQQHSGSSHNFFFLDEGFGTLDKDSLAAVFEALTQLRAENRIVGVISHVEDMQQEIEVYLKVTQTEERGSLVRGSWE